MKWKLEPIPQLPVSCLAEMVDRGRRSPESILRRFKFTDDAEGRARTICHPPALTAIRKYYSADKDIRVVDQWIDTWMKKAEATDNKAARATAHKQQGDSHSIHS